jgi:hypothetical protein
MQVQVIKPTNTEQNPLIHPSRRTHQSFTIQFQIRNRALWFADHIQMQVESTSELSGRNNDQHTMQLNVLVTISRIIGQCCLDGQA